MQNDEREQFHEELWKSQEVSQLQMTTEEVCAKAHKLERTGIRMYWAIFMFMVAATLLYVYRLTQFHQPWLISGTVWAVGSLGYTMWGLIRNGPTRMRPAEPCIHFLVREFEAKRRGLLLVRQLALLFVPTILAMWLGGGPGTRGESIWDPIALVAQASRRARFIGRNGSDRRFRLLRVLTRGAEGQPRNRKAKNVVMKKIPADGLPRIRQKMIKEKSQIEHS